MNENTIAGINLSYLPSSSTNYPNLREYPLKYRNNGYSAGVFYRKYKSLGKEFFLFGEASASMIGQMNPEKTVQEKMHYRVHRGVVGVRFLSRYRIPGFETFLSGTQLSLN